MLCETDTMTESKLLKAYAERWQKFGPQIEALQKKSLRERSEEEHRQVIHDVLSGSIEWFLQGSRKDSGLIEQQRIFRTICRN